ncbi:Predicted oxidoreductase [Altererythrobacter xiamenensis]|uniref:Predicted oxidoreductase n=1 Tax=Altererythrobacter xiamenensis TaxID=1316679 RepID=A0A1Y6FIF1_9SPHN|nr:aldo/keto reductase [Altererythrobacter xiamenensis]SMQ73341.1 Predicted oxidoreductase [Altererythrobacter xiamenensis]
MAIQNERTLAGRSVDPIGLGCMNLSWAYGDPPPHEDKVRLLNEALDLGYNHLDTANIYGLGKNEELLADAVMHRRDEFLLASKTGIVVDGKRRGIDCSPEAIAESLDASLARLKTDHIDLFYMHRLDRNTPIADSVGAMARAIEAGKIGAYGVSEWSSAHIREAHDVHPMAAVQTEMSLWTRNVELGVLETTRELGIALVPFSPVARGALGGELKDPQSLAEKDLRRSMPRFDGINWPENLAMIERFDDLAAEAGVEPAQLALAWVLAQGDHVHAIPGTTSIEHMRENFAASSLEIATDVLTRAGAIINEQTVKGHRYSEAMRQSIDTEDYPA